MSFGYPTINGQNNVTQQRRSVDMIYQRGATYDVTLTGTTYEDSMELVVDLYNNNHEYFVLYMTFVQISPNHLC